MPYTTPPTFADGNILTATQLNTLSSDIEFLYGIVLGGINPPFHSLRTTSDLSSSNNLWTVYHQHRYLHYKARVTQNDNNDLDIFVFSVRVYHDGTTRSNPYTYSGYIDLDDPTTWSDWIGAWATSTSYSLHDVVSNGGNYYACKQAHTSSASDEPGVGGSWTTYWTQWSITVGTYATMYVVTNLSATPQFVVDYLLESDSTTL